MIKARPHQQQPPHPSECPYCAARFNNYTRAARHIVDKLGDGVHPEPEAPTRRPARQVLPHRTGGPPRHGMSSLYPL